MKKQVAGLKDDALSQFVTMACRAARINGEVNVLITSNREMQSLNSRFRKKDIPTDVLSFPAPHNLADKISGDIAISAEIAQDNAKCLGHSGIEEIQILVLHGVLHLAGLDHERDNGEMARKEMRLRRTLGLPTGLIERTSSPSTAKSRKNSLTTTSARLKSKTPRKSG